MTRPAIPSIPVRANAEQTSCEGRRNTRRPRLAELSVYPEITPIPTPADLRRFRGPQKSTISSANSQKNPSPDDPGKVSVGSKGEKTVVVQARTSSPRHSKISAIERALLPVCGRAGQIHVELAELDGLHRVHAALAVNGESAAAVLRIHNLCSHCRGRGM